MSRKLLRDNSMFTSRLGSHKVILKLVKTGHSISLFCLTYFRTPLSTTNLEVTSLYLSFANPTRRRRRKKPVTNSHINSKSINKSSIYQAAQVTVRAKTAMVKRVQTMCWRRRLLILVWAFQLNGRSFCSSQCRS